MLFRKRKEKKKKHEKPSGTFHLPSPHPHPACRHCYQSCIFSKNCSALTQASMSIQSFLLLFLFLFFPMDFIFYSKIEQEAQGFPVTPFPSPIIPDQSAATWICEGP